MRRTLIPAALLLTACPAPPEEPAPEPVPHHDPAVARPRPEPLPARPFKTPTTEVRTLSNGLQVVVANNPEVPIVDVTLAFNVGDYVADRPGLTGATFDMLDEGAGDMSSEDISRALKAMASDLSTGGSDDGAGVSITTLKRNLEPTLDLMAKVVTEPTFPAEEWSILQRRYVAGVKNARKDPNAIASRVADHLLYGDTYRGRVAMESDYERLEPAALQAFYGQWFGPSNAIVLVGGDITADEIMPLLEARLGSWNPDGVQSAEPEATPKAPDSPVVYLVDKPGAAQSVIRAMTVVGSPTDDDWYPFNMGLDVLGGTFMSRLNMNLREDKGYTYGARCGVDTRYGPSIASCGASVRTDVTGASMVETLKELQEIGGDRKITEDELTYMKGTRVNQYPQRFETSGALLGEQQQIWRYGLPADWPERYLPGIEGVSLEQAQAALGARWNLENTVWLVVGDKAVIQKELEAFALPIVEIDADGRRVGG